MRNLHENEIAIIKTGFSIPKVLKKRVHMHKYITHNSQLIPVGCIFPVNNDDISIMSCVH
jgi:hypothetical protein